jgi:hypothetical protein
VNTVLHKVEDKYPKLSEIYREIDASFQQYSDSIRLVKVKCLYKKIEEVFEKWNLEHKESDILKDMKNEDNRYCVYFLVNIYDILSSLISECSVLYNTRSQGHYNHVVWSHLAKNNLPDRAFKAYLEDAKS